MGEGAGFKPGDRVAAKELGRFAGKVVGREVRDGEPWLSIKVKRLVWWEEEQWVKESNCRAQFPEIDQQPESQGD